MAPPGGVPTISVGGLAGQGCATAQPSQNADAMAAIQCFFICCLVLASLHFSAAPRRRPPLPFCVSVDETLYTGGVQSIRALDRGIHVLLRVSAAGSASLHEL